MTTNRISGANGISRRAVLQGAAGIAGATALGLGMGGVARGQGQTTITFTHHESQYLRELQGVIQAFEAANPDIKVQADATPWTSAFSQLSNQSQTGTLPDVFIVGDTWVSPFAKIGALADLTDRIAAWDRGANGKFDDDVYPGDKLFYNLDSKWYGVPFICETRLLFYRKDWFEEAGIAVPTTHDEFVAAAKALTDPSQGRYGYGFIGNPDGVTFQTFCTWAIQRGAQLFKRDASGALVSNLQSPEFIDAMQWYTDLALKEKVVPDGAAGFSQTDVESGFQGGSLGMIVTGPWAIAAMNANPELTGKWDVAKLPAGPANGTSFLGGVPLVMSSTAKNPDAVWRFIQYMSTYETAAPFLVGSNSIPGFKSMADQFLSTAPDKEKLKPFLDALPNAVPNSYPEPAPAVLATMTDGQMPIQYALQDVLTGQKTVAEAVAEADAKVNELLAQ